MATLTAPAQVANRAPRRRGRRGISPLLLAFVLVPLVVEAFWVFWPAIQGFYLSFTDWDGISAPRNIGFGNYVQMFSDPVFGKALLDTVIWLVLFGGISTVGGLGMAMLLQRERRGVGFYRSALFTPVVFSLVATSLIWQGMYEPDGLLNKILGGIGLSSWEHSWLADPHTALYAVIIPALWREIGYVMVLFLAGLKGIDPVLYEAAKMDGAGALQRFTSITLPSLRSVNSVVLSVIVIDSLRSFDVVWALTRGGPFHSSELLSTYMYSEAFQTLHLGYASALATVIFVLALGVIITYLVRAFRESDS
ncbi:MAG TPA: sugar ABC transporter permease [Pseudonocardiaceae bacterium]|nr:sugar ABC transporter permease [Pseudonocardiaceae bacterium]